MSDDLTFPSKWGYDNHLVYCLPIFYGSGGILNLQQFGKPNYFNNVFFFSLAHLCMSLHAYDENCENLILFEFFVFSQGVSLGFFALDVHVVKSSFLLFDFLDRYGVDGLNRFFCGVD